MVTPGHDASTPSNETPLVSPAASAERLRGSSHEGHFSGAAPIFMSAGRRPNRSSPGRAHAVLTVVAGSAALSLTIFLP